MVHALLGGALIGAAVAILLLANGRVAGISGTPEVWSKPHDGEWTWRVPFVAGLVAGGIFAELAAPGSVGHWPARSLLVLAIAGALVGLGTRIAGGCTSSHGVCGTSRLSFRSISATATFVMVAAAVVS